MTNRTFALITLLILCVSLAFPVCQIFKNNGLIFYSNGVDESSYLQYDYSKYVFEVAGISRSGQWAVNFLHELGVSGGWINFLFDFLSIPLIIFILRNILKQAGFPSARSNLITILTFTILVWLSTANPLIVHINQWLRESGLGFWVVAPEFETVSWLRSPEPQWTYIFSLICTWLSLRLKNVLPLILVSIMYPFVAVPVAWIAISVLLIRFTRNIWIAQTISYLLLSLLLWGANSFLFGIEVKTFLTSSHLPILPFFGVLSILLWRFVPSEIGKLIHPYGALIVVSGLIAVNTQILSGWFIQPYNYEQYWTSCVCAFVIALIFSESKLVKPVAISAVVGFLLFSIQQFRAAQDLTDRLNLTDEARLNLIQSSNLVAVPDVRLASWLNLAFPKQYPTQFSITNAYGALAAKTFGQYQCAKKNINRDPALKAEFEATVTWLDEIYCHNNADYFPNHLGRKRFDSWCLPYQEMNSCTEQPLVWHLIPAL